MSIALIWLAVRLGLQSFPAPSLRWWAEDTNCWKTTSSNGCRTSLVGCGLAKRLMIVFWLSKLDGLLLERENNRWLITLSLSFQGTKNFLQLVVCSCSNAAAFLKENGETGVTNVLPGRVSHKRVIFPWGILLLNHRKTRLIFVYITDF